MTHVMRLDWFTREIGESFDLTAPGIYEWRIEGVGIYVGKALKLRSRLNNYPNNVRRMVLGLPWHGNPSREYRPIHKELRAAYDSGLKVTVAVLENCPADNRRDRENYWIQRRRHEEARGGPRVLNATS